jgi:hypothetical protein
MKAWWSLAMRPPPNWGQLDEADVELVLALVREHQEKTGSPRAAAVLKTRRRMR